MKSIEVELREEHLHRFKNAPPLKAIAELIWNSLDADATEVIVSFKSGELTELGEISIQDNGSGIDAEKVEELFGFFGASWKSNAGRTSSGRFLHGKNGEGRFKAFSLGNSITWETYYKNNGKSFFFTISGSGTGNSIKNFTSSDIREKTGKGTTVTIREIEKDFKIKNSHGGDEKIRDIFALYLYKYPSISLVYDEQEIDVSSAIELVKDYPITTETENGDILSATLSVVEWHHPVTRRLSLCAPGFFPIHETQPQIRARGFNFTAYLTSEYFQSFIDNNLEAFIESDHNTQLLIEGAKEKLREHFREREINRSQSKIEEWKNEDIYPYKGSPENSIDKNEREVFEIVALGVSDYSNEFERSPKESQKLIFGLIKNAVKTNPGNLHLILKEVINLPKEHQDDFAQLLNKTSLISIINAVKSVTDRLDFLKALNILVFDAKSKKQLLERAQLQKILTEHTWVFGEEFHLTNDDEDLKTVLKKHLEILGQERKGLTVEPVFDAEGKVRVVDLMLHRRIPLSRGEDREHLVVELKRPKKKINRDDLSQISNYAHTVAKDERFDKVNVRWTFLIISNEIDDYVESRMKQKDKPYGLVEDLEGLQIQIWVKTWGQIIQETEARLEFFKKGLEYSASEKNALEYLSQMKKKYLPESVNEKITELESN